MIAKGTELWHAAAFWKQALSQVYNSIQFRHIKDAKPPQRTSTCHPHDQKNWENYGMCSSRVPESCCWTPAQEHLATFSIGELIGIHGQQKLLIDLPSACFRMAAFESWDSGMIAYTPSSGYLLQHYECESWIIVSNHQQSPTTWTIKIFGYDQQELGSSR